MVYFVPNPYPKNSSGDCSCCAFKDNAKKQIKAAKIDFILFLFKVVNLLKVWGIGGDFFGEVEVYWFKGLRV